MNNSPVCIDANLVIQLVTLPAENPVRALWERWVQEERKVIAPDLLFYEVTNALYRYQEQGLLNPETVRLALEAALSLPIDIISDRHLHQQALLVADEYGLPAAYDAHYLALARLHDAELWTGDRRLFNACQQKWINLAV